LAAIPSQSTQPASHTILQAPASHRGVAWGAPAHTLPQRPQWEAAVCGSTQAPPQLAVPAGQVVAHARPLHIAGARHGAPQAPQFSSVPSVTSHPSAAVPLQLA